MTHDLTILGIAGSLRARSYNMLALKAAQELCPAGAKIEIFQHLGQIPNFNQDLEHALPAAGGGPEAPNTCGRRGHLRTR